MFLPPNVNQPTNLLPNVYLSTCIYENCCNIFFLGWIICKYNCGKKMFSTLGQIIVCCWAKQLWLWWTKKVHLSLNCWVFFLCKITKICLQSSHVQTTSDSGCLYAYYTHFKLAIHCSQGSSSIVAHILWGSRPIAGQRRGLLEHGFQTPWVHNIHPEIGVIVKERKWNVIDWKRRDN